ncbi:MAG: Rpn family recombination-promoting nuclease/putative transposase [Faecalicoccus sp.]|nr:Rpn family recombination-promoting nuclease/putative transposase [Faecalicoccus sp.]
MADIVSASYDVVFKALFVRHQDLLRVFLEDILDLTFKDEDEIIVLNPELVPETSDEKLIRLDIHVRTADRKFNIKMQAHKNGLSAERVLYYWSKMYIKKLKSGEDYEDLHQTYSINILGFNFLEFEEYHSKYSILNETRFHKLTDKLSIHFFELPKVPDEMIPNDDRQMWMQVFKADSKEKLDMIKSNTQNPAIQKATDAVYELNADEVLQEQIWVREKALNDYYNDMTVARKEGRKEGQMEMLKQLVEEGVLTVSQAADKINMTIDEFLLKTGLKL